MPDRGPRNEPPPCPGCERTMRLVGRERDEATPNMEVLTFECDCGHVTTATLGH